jgi:hypothetical protein
MQLAYIHGGGKTRVQKFQIGATLAEGIGIESPEAPLGGVVSVTTITGIDVLGISLDAQDTYNTAQQADNSDPAAFVSVVTNADAVFQCRLNGSATVDGTALVKYFNTTANTDGNIVVPSLTSGGATVDTTAMDDCTIFGYTGANAGIARKISVADATDVNVAVAFPYDIAVDDLFIFSPFVGGQLHYVTFTTSLKEADATVATGEDIDNVNFRPVENVLNDAGNNGDTNSYVNLITVDHAFGGGYTA